jgi:hypothetical protein
VRLHSLEIGAKGARRFYSVGLDGLSVADRMKLI